LGLTFKPNTDDMRDSPAIAVAQTLQDAGVNVAAYDPEGMELAAPLMPGVDMKKGVYEAIKAPVLVDLRNVYDPAEIRAKGFEYSSVGRV